MHRRRETRRNQTALGQWFNFRQRSTRRPLADQETLGTTIAAPMEQHSREEKSAALRPSPHISCTKPSKAASSPRKSRAGSPQFEPNTRPPSLKSESTMIAEKKQSSTRGTPTDKRSSSNTLSSPQSFQKEEVVNGIPNWDSPRTKKLRSESEDFFQISASQKTYRDDLSKASKEDSRIDTCKSSGGSSGPGNELFHTKKDTQPCKNERLRDEGSASGSSGPDVEVFRISRKGRDEDENEQSIEEFSREPSLTSADLPSESFATYDEEAFGSKSLLYGDTYQAKDQNRKSSCHRSNDVKIINAKRAEKTDSVPSAEEREEEMIRIAMERSLLDCDLLRSHSSSLAESEEREEEMIQLAMQRSIRECDLKRAAHTAPTSFPSAGTTMDLGASMDFSELCYDESPLRYETTNSPSKIKEEFRQLQEDDKELTSDHLAAIEQQEQEMIELALQRSMTETSSYQSSWNMRSDVYRRNTAASLSISSIYCDETSNELDGQAATHPAFARYVDRSTSPSNVTTSDFSSETQQEKELIDLAIQNILQDSQPTCCSAVTGLGSNVASVEVCSTCTPTSSDCIDHEDTDSHCTGPQIPRNQGLSNQSESLQLVDNCSYSSFSRARSLLESTDEQSMQDDLSVDDFVAPDNMYPFSRETVQEQDRQKKGSSPAGSDGGGKPASGYSATFERPASYFVKRPTSSVQEESHLPSYSRNSYPSSPSGREKNHCSTGRPRETESERFERMEREMMDLAIRRSMRDS